VKEKNKGTNGTECLDRERTLRIHLKPWRPPIVPACLWQGAYVLLLLGAASAALPHAL
jgi:hypothetical protein